MLLQVNIDLDHRVIEQQLLHFLQSYYKLENIHHYINDCENTIFICIGCREFIVLNCIKPVFFYQSNNKDMYNVNCLQNNSQKCGKGLEFKINFKKMEQIAISLLS